VLKTGNFGKKITNTLQVLKCGAGEEWRREMKYKEELSEEEFLTNNKKKEG